MSKVVLTANSAKIALGLFVSGAAGQANEAANVGGGAGVFRDKTGVTLNFRSLVGTGDVAAAVAGDTVEIDVPSAVKDEFTPTNNQITFVLSSTPTDTDTIIFEVNGVIYDDVADWTIVGNTITWLDTEFQMQTTDHVVVRYR